MVCTAGRRRGPGLAAGDGAQKAANQGGQKGSMLERHMPLAQIEGGQRTGRPCFLGSDAVGRTQWVVHKAVLDLYRLMTKPPV